MYYNETKRQSNTLFRYLPFQSFSIALEDLNFYLASYPFSISYLLR